MLTKIDTRVVRQRESRLRRIWYHDAGSDVLLDYERPVGGLVAIEIDWEGTRGRRSCVQGRSLTGVRTGTVDAGDCIGALHYKRAPLFLVHRNIDVECVARAREIVNASGMPESLQRLILARLRE